MVLNMLINVWRIIALLDKNNMKFGVYSYSLYENAMMLEMKLKRFIVVHLKLHSM